MCSVSGVLFAPRCPVTLPRAKRESAGSSCSSGLPDKPPATSRWGRAERGNKRLSSCDSTGSPSTDPKAVCEGRQPLMERGHASCTGEPGQGSSQKGTGMPPPPGWGWFVETGAPSGGVLGGGTIWGSSPLRPGDLNRLPALYSTLASRSSGKCSAFNSL